MVAPFNHSQRYDEICANVAVHFLVVMDGAI